MTLDLSAAVREVPGGVQLVVFCQPRAARSALIGMHGGALKAKVKAPPVDGKANLALLHLIAEALDVPPAQVSLVSGEQSRNKRIQVAGVDGPTALVALAAALAPLSEEPKNSAR